MVTTGWVISGLLALFIVGASAAPKLLGPEARLALLYLYPATSLLGAVLMTGLLGGAIASQLRIDTPLFSHTLFGFYLGVAMWVGLWLRSPRIRDVFPMITG